MTIGEQIEMKQPLIYNFLIDCFELEFDRTERVDPVEYEEDSYLFRHYKRIMEERKAVEI